MRRLSLFFGSKGAVLACMFKSVGFTAAHCLTEELF